MTHEFKTPISTIAVSTEVLKDPDIVRQPERLLNYTSIIEKENNRLKQQVERVLQMAKLDKEDYGLRKELVDVHDIIRESIRSVTMGLHNHKAPIQCQLDALQHVLAADKLHLTNVFYNLLDNALKYCTKAPEIHINTQNTATHLVVTVSDNGIGIAPENHRRIFQKFYRVPTGNVHDVKGFGLGLNYVKGIVENHGGKISLQSQLGHGCMFTLSLPLNQSL
ncbi:MAG: HAMP domain-containing histidine kinase [Bacteroidia bacterium]|nr:HAMP domain-containing histidine kinase [Bacteroidia bacterium]